jgi:hypothetical protein
MKEISMEDVNMEKDKEMPHYRTPMSVKMDLLTKEGFDTEFQITSEGLKAIKWGKVYQPNELKIVEHFRFEGISDPDDMAVMYVVTTNDGLKGTVVDAFGLYANEELLSFMNKVEDQTVKNL